MKLQTAAALTLIASVLTLATAPAQAFTFTGFGFKTDFSPQPADPNKDIKLESITNNITGKTYNEFKLVNKAVIQVNGTSIGPGSSDRGDGTVMDAYLPQGPRVENPTNADVVASLGNLNLNSIIDTEDNHGVSVIDIFFENASKEFVFFERGANSDLKVEALDAAGNVIALINPFTIQRSKFLANLAGYSINTGEIPEPQKVGSYGLSLDFKVAGLRLSSNNTMNGPDYKVFAAKVPEPGTIAALGTVAGLAVLARRKKNQAAAQ